MEQEAEGKGPRGGYGQAWLMPVPATIGYGLTQADTVTVPVAPAECR
jgi:hypothetical protein